MWIDAINYRRIEMGKWNTIGALGYIPILAIRETANRLRFMRCRPRMGRRLGVWLKNISIVVGNVAE